MIIASATLANYIRENLECPSTNLKYETYVQEERRKKKGLGTWRIVVFSHSGIFIFTQLMAVAIELSKTTSLEFPPLKWILLAVDLAAILMVCWIANHSGR